MASPDDTEVCATCAVVGPDFNFHSCSACCSVYYCGVACQRKHWRIHRLQCKNAAEAEFRRVLAAARAGNATGQYNAASCLILGRGVAPNASESLMWLRRAAEANFPPALHHLGCCYISRANSWSVTKCKGWF
jgi:TPR repeat protein